MAKNNKLLTTLQNIFGIYAKKSGDSVTIAPGTSSEKDKDSKDPFSGRPKRVSMPEEMERLYGNWINGHFDTQESFKNRMGRYEDLEYMYYNNGIASTAIDLYADETTQNDADSDIINVYAKSRKVEKYIKDFFERIGLDENLLKSIAFDVSLYGDAFLVHSYDADKGITEVVPVDAKSVKDRLEFNAIQVKQAEADQMQMLNTMTSRYDKMQDLYDVLTNPTDNFNFSQKYKSFLFGYDVNGEMLPPWGVSHFRRFSTNTEFFPFGRPIMINAISPYRQLQAAKNLMALLRTQKFPIRIFEVAAEKNMSPTKLWETMEDVRSEYYNQGQESATKDAFAGNTEVWTVENLFKLNVEENRVNLNDIADIELLQDNLIIATRIPKGYLISDRGSFGQSGQSLLQQSKIFGRGVYSIQSAILETLIDLVRLQFILTDEFEYDEEFEITMNFPVVEQSQDQLRMKNDTMRLAKDILDNLGTAIGLGRDEALPPEVVKQVYSHYSFLDAEDIENWVDSTLASLEHPEESAKGKEKLQRIYEKADRITEDTLRMAYFDAKKNRRMNEGVQHSRHFYTSCSLPKSKKEYYDLVKSTLKEEKNKKLDENEQ